MPANDLASLPAAVPFGQNPDDLLLKETVLPHPSSRATPAVGQTVTLSLDPFAVARSSAAPTRRVERLCERCRWPSFNARRSGCELQHAASRAAGCGYERARTFTPVSRSAPVTAPDSRDGLTKTSTASIRWDAAQTLAFAGGTTRPFNWLDIALVFWIWRGYRLAGRSITMPLALLEPARLRAQYGGPTS